MFVAKAGSERSLIASPCTWFSLISANEPELVPSVRSIGDPLPCVQPADAPSWLEPNDAVAAGLAEALTASSRAAIVGTARAIAHLRLTCLYIDPFRPR